MRREEPEYKHAIRTRVTLSDHAGTHAVTHSVYCAMHDQSVPLATCIACPKLIAFPARPAAIGANVTCHAPAGAVLRTNDVERAATRTHISEIMNRNVVCVLASAGWESLERLLLDDEFEAVPVVDAHGRPIGIVSKTDLLRRTRSDEGEVDPHPESLPEPGVHIDRRAGITAEDMMTPVVHALPEDAPLSFVIAALALEGVTQIPIVSKGGLVVGMVSTHDAVTWLARQIGCISFSAV